MPKTQEFFLSSTDLKEKNVDTSDDGVIGPGVAPSVESLTPSFITPDLQRMADEARDTRRAINWDALQADVSPGSSVVDKVTDFHTAGSRLIHMLVPNYTARKVPLSLLNAICDYLVNNTNV